MNIVFEKRVDETEAEFCHRIADSRADYGLDWEDVAYICNLELGLELTPGAYKTREYRYKASQHVEEEIMEEETEMVDEEVDFSEEVKEALIEIKKEKYKATDERTQANALIRRVAREETIKEIAADLATKMAGSIVLPAPKVITDCNPEQKDATLLLSDWHYGVDIDNHWNVYNPDIAKKRIAKLRDKVIEKLKVEKIKHINIINMGDLISGRIHNTIRINNRMDVITQTIEVSELLAQFLNDISEVAQVEYYDTLDNHSRLEPNLSDSLDLESLVRVLNEFLKLRLAGNKNVHMIENRFGDDIATFTAAGHKCIGVHGHKDKPTKIIDNLSMLTQDHYDLVVSAHYHHFNADEQNQTFRICNGSLMGTDDYAVGFRLNSEPSQTLIISTSENVVDGVHKINL